MRFAGFADFAGLVRGVAAQLNERIVDGKVAVNRRRFVDHPDGCFLFHLAPSHRKSACFDLGVGWLGQCPWLDLHHRDAHFRLNHLGWYPFLVEVVGWAWMMGWYSIRQSRHCHPWKRLPDGGLERVFGRW
ncbi:MAG: hypothetical protein NZM37_02005 [Sandaracinaceae bacterium]|nr:hypothetical protein [Sandaracinaceae bacterium]